MLKFIILFLKADVCIKTILVIFRFLMNLEEVLCSEVFLMSLFLVIETEPLKLNKTERSHHGNICAYPALFVELHLQSNFYVVCQISFKGRSYAICSSFTWILKLFLVVWQRSCCLMSQPQGWTAWLQTSLSCFSQSLHTETGLWSLPSISLAQNFSR